MAGAAPAVAAAILARPLFAPSRRPPAPETAAAAPPAPLPRVAGIMIDGPRRSVIFAGTDGSRPLVVGLGAEVAGFRVTAIEPGAVTVSGAQGGAHPAAKLRLASGPRPGRTGAAQPAGADRRAGLARDQFGERAAGSERVAAVTGPARAAGHTMRGCALLLSILLAGCETVVTPPALLALPEPLGTAAAAARLNGAIGTTDASPAAQVSIGRSQTVALPGQAANEAGDITLNFVDTDIREVVAQVLGTILRVNYTMDPAIRGTATLRTVQPVSRSQALAALNAVLGQNGATISQSGAQSGGLYRVVPAAASTAGLAGGPGVAGGTVVPLRYASAEELAKLLQPYAGTAGKVLADPGRNALIVAGDAATRDALLGLIRAFDIGRAGRAVVRVAGRSPRAGPRTRRPRCRTRSAPVAAGRWPAWCGWCRWSGSTRC